MTIAIASDHRGVLYKKELINYLTKQNFNIIDCSKENTPTDDYPDFAFSVCKEVVNKNADFGILVCRSGIGMSIAANKVKGVRCALLSDVWSAKMTRLHNDTNVMALGGGVVGEHLALEIVDTWLGTEFTGEERHNRRLAKLAALEQ